MITRTSEPNLLLAMKLNPGSMKRKLVHFRNIMEHCYQPEASGDTGSLSSLQNQPKLLQY
jgi:hypothetical protein